MMRLLGFPVILAITLLLSPAVVLAHQPRIVTENPTIVVAPEVSKAYYGTLQGEPHVFKIFAKEPFEMYLNLLVPELEGAKRDVSAAIIYNGDTKTPLAVLDANLATWEPMYEPYGGDMYLKGPEFKAGVGAGEYEIRVWSSNNDSTYAFAIGEEELFDFEETANAIRLIPEIKRVFFKESGATFLFSIFGAVYALAMMLCGVFAGWAVRKFIHWRGSAKYAPRNIGIIDRVARFFIAVGLFAWAITSSWNPLMLFFSGLALYESFARWCVFYAAFGKNTCRFD